MCDTIYVNRINWFIHIFLNQEVVGNSDRTGDKTLNLQQFFAMSLGLSVENICYIAIALLACVLGAEIAGICMLVGKLRRARSGEEDVIHDEYNSNGGANYAIAALSFGAVSAAAELVLLILAIAALVGAFIICVLLVVLYAKGYLLISAKTARAAAEAEAAAIAAKKAEQEAAERAAQEAAAREAALAYEAQEEALEEEDDYEGDEAAQEAISNLIATEEAVMAEEYEEEVVEEVIEATDTAVVAQDPAQTVVQTVERTIITEGAPAYGGQAPIVEKHIIETTKEIIKETNTTTVTEGNKSEQFSPATEEMMKAITEFMKLETQLRMEREMAVEHPAQEEGESTPVFAETEEEEIEADEIDTEDELDVEDEAEREADAEENDDEYESDLFGNERIVGFDEETGCYIIARYRKSCEAKLIQARPATKKYYSAIRNALMGYEGTKERMSWAIDTYTNENEHVQIAKINVRPRTLDLYLALDPATLEDSVYRGKDVGSKKKYAETPFLYKVNSPRKFMLALELVQRACEEQGLSPIDIEEVNYEEQYPFTDTETLISRGLIREYLREEKPAATFELDPDHVPQLVEEDETVIPANANFTWEFDNDQPETEEVVEEEPVIEEVVEVEEEPIVQEEVVVEEEPVVEEPTVEAPAAPAPGTTTTTTTTHETIRTTERHYTERYYGNGKQAEISEEARTIEVLPEPAAEPIEVVAEEIVPETAQEPLAEEVVEEVVEEVEEVIEEEPQEEVIEEVVEEEIIDEEIEEEIEETTDEQIAQMQNAVAALFGDDIFEEDEPIEEPAPEEVTEEEVTEEEVIEEEVIEEIVEEEVLEEESVEETVEEEPIEEEPQEEVIEEEVIEESEEEIYEDEFDEETDEESEEILEEVYYEEVYEEAPEEEEEVEYYEEVVYEEEPEEELYEEVYEDEEIYEPIEGEEFEEVYEEVYEEEVEAEEEIYEEEVEEEPAPTPAPQPASDVVLLDVCVFDDYFDNGAIVNLETLKQVGLAPESATRLKVYASGALKGQFTVEANHFTLDAIKAIGDADGDSIMIR